MTVRNKVIRFRAADEDERILERLVKKLGIDGSSVLRMALRKLAELEGVLKR